MRQSTPVTFESHTGGITLFPTRLALAIISTSRWWWVLLFVLVPVGFLAGALWITPRIANGLVGICGFLALILWSVSYYNYNGSRTQINVATRTLTVTHENASQLERTVDLDQVESVSVQVFGSVALIRIEEHTFSRVDRFVLPEPFLVPVTQLSTALDAVHATGVTIQKTGPENEPGYETRSIEAAVRLAVTPLILVGVPLSAFFLFGQSVLVTNGAMIVFVLGLVAIVRELREG